MNNIYNWHDERMVNYEMGEVNRAMEQARLLREAGLSDSDWLARGIKALRGLFTAGWERLHIRRSVESQAQVSRCEKCAP